MKLLCAPMASISHAAFRMLVERFGGCDEYFNEMINAPSLVSGGKFEEFYIEGKPVPQKLARQLTGKNAESLIAAAKILSPLEAVGIDLNMGCSAPEIVKSGAGIAWMLKPSAETERMVRGVKAALNEYEAQSGVHRRLSVKLRLGDADFTDEGFFSFCDMLCDSGVELITLHPRTKKEKFRAPPRYSYAQELSLRCRERGVKVCVNGDITDAKSARAVLKQCPDCDALMIGRAAAQKPWIFAEIKKNLADGDDCTGDSCGTENDGDKTKVDLLELAAGFIEDVKRYQPQEFWKTRLQRFFAYFCKNFWFENYVKNKLLNAPSPEDALAVLEDYFARVEGDRYKRVRL
ncbi:MAG: tRNA-dihydrouridine synthase family protein [Treponema sp.]